MRWQYWRTTGSPASEAPLHVKKIPARLPGFFLSRFTSYVTLSSTVGAVEAVARLIRVHFASGAAGFVPSLFKGCVVNTTSVPTRIGFSAVLILINREHR